MNERPSGYLRGPYGPFPIELVHEYGRIVERISYVEPIHLNTGEMLVHDYDYRAESVLVWVVRESAA
jgi:hypothetical protein